MGGAWGPELWWSMSKKHSLLQQVLQSGDEDMMKPELKRTLLPSLSTSATAPKPNKKPSFILAADHMMGIITLLPNLVDPLAHIFITTLR